MPEFAKDTGKKKKSRKRKKKRAKRKGSGNRPKPEPSQSNHHALDFCPNCTKPLFDQPVVEITTRIVEDIPDPPTTTIVTEEVCEKKWCLGCQKSGGIFD